MKEYNYLRTGCAVPVVHLGDCAANVKEIINLCDEALAAGVSVLNFPELCITGYTLGDLFFQRTLIDDAEVAVAELCTYSRDKGLFIVVSAPVNVDAGLYNCGLAICDGKILGIVPKTYLPENAEFYEKRWFRSSTSMKATEVDYAGQRVPVGTDLIFVHRDWPEVKIGIEICEDLWATIPPSNYLALAGATLILNPSASNELTGKDVYRDALIKQQSERCNAAYLYASAGFGESTTDMVYAGDALIYERGNLLKRSAHFATHNQLITADVDLEILAGERLRQSSYTDSKYLLRYRTYREIYFQVADAPDLQREISPSPFIPAGDGKCQDRCQEVTAIQTMGLGSRLAHIGNPAMVIGVSGGLDSTLALLICVEVADKFGLDRKTIHGVTMPGFGTTDRTYDNAVALIKELGVTFHEIPIRDAVSQHFKDIGHEANNHDATYENAQARERTQILMDLAGEIGGLVVGTGDLSELALGWATYNGDHMSMYGVNASVPKTLIRHVLESMACSCGDERIKVLLLDILGTPVSPELLPPDGAGEIVQKTEDLVGPYELHDFFLFYVLRHGFSPEKIYFLAKKAFAGRYDAPTIRKWLMNFYRRFFSQQFKRSCLPDGPKVGTVSLSPRGDWRMPSDAKAEAYVRRIEAIAD